jgi:FtsP/CotA-like multicopper oxidase with cupredoxin domain
MHRREFLASCASAALASRVAVRRRADYTLRIAPLKLELAHGTTVDTTAYNGVVPGPLLRMRAGVPVTIDVTNDTDKPEFVHWHGLEIPAESDGVMEQGASPIPAHGNLTYQFTPSPIGTRWYHSHAFAGRDLHRATYSGQFGFLLIDGAPDPGRYDQEFLLALHDWDGYITGGDDGFQSVAYRYASINGRLLGAADPIRVRAGERVLFRLLNASASEMHWLSLPGHRFTVIALDGNSVPTRASVEQLRIAPGERIDAIVEMNAPGVWILGEPRDVVRRSGLGIVVEYAGQGGAPQWRNPVDTSFEYPTFGAAVPTTVGDVERVSLVFKSAFHGHGAFEGWTINGRSWPHIDPVLLASGTRYRLLLDNQSIEDHPIHLHRHTMEITRVAGQEMSGVRKDTIVVPARTVVEADFVANNPGKSLFHCHLQDHMDAGFMMLFDYR